MPRPRASRALTMAAALALTGTVGLAACGGDSAANDPHHLTWYINPDSGGNDPSKQGQARIAAECTTEAGGAYSISTQVLPNSASDQRQQLLRRLAAGDPGVDIMSLDPVFVAEFAEAGFLDPVPQDKTQQFTENAVDPIVESATWKDQLVAAPFWANTQLLWYRKSVAQEAGLDMSKPVTWDQIIDAAQKTGRTIGVQASRYEGYSVMINALIEGAGGSIVKNPGATGEQVQLGIDSPEGKRAAEIIQKISTTGVGGPALSSTDETQALNLFIGESTSGFMLNWPYVWAAMHEQKVPFVDDVAWTTYPRTEADQQAKPPLGGIEVAVHTASLNKDAAWDAVACITTKEHQELYMLGTGNPAADKRVYDSPAIREEFPMADTIRTSLDGGAPRPVTQYYGDVSAGLQRSWSPPEEVNPDTTPPASQQLIQDVLAGEALL